MQCKVALEVWVYDDVVVRSGGCGGVDSLHASVETQDEVVEIESESQSLTDGNLTVEFVPSEHSAGLVGIILDVPDVSGVDERRSLKFPEYR